MEKYNLPKGWKYEVFDKIENPNAAKSCGCSKSFSVEGEEYDTCGGCGYK